MTRKHLLRLFAVLFVAMAAIAVLTFATQRVQAASCPNCIVVDTYDDSFSVCGDFVNLRCAINYANATPGTFIRFDLSVVTVTLLSALPPITRDGTWIDGSDSNGTYVGPILTGASWSGAAGNALTINANYVTISNLKVINIPAGGADISIVGGKDIEISYDYLGILPGATQCGGTQATVGVDVANDRAGGVGNSGTAYIFADTISCHGGSGVEVVSSNYVYVGVGRDNSTPFPNYIGTTSNGVGAAGNGYAGVRVAVNSDQVTVSHNRIAYNANGGVIVDGTNINVVFNTLSANYWGLAISGGSTQLIVGNKIGTSPDGMLPLPNTHEGILISGGSGLFLSDNLVAYNGAAGIAVTGDSTHADIQNNDIYRNGGLPIDLGNDGPTPNGTHGTSGPNNWLWYPVVTSFSGNIVLGTACGKCNVYVFKAVGNPAALGGGGVFKTNAVANSSGQWSVDLSAYGLTRLDVTFTAADMGGNTSEMSPRGQLMLPLIRR